MKDEYEPIITREKECGFIGDDQGLDYLGSEITGP